MASPSLFSMSVFFALTTTSFVSSLAPFDDADAACIKCRRSFNDDDDDAQGLRRKRSFGDGFDFSMSMGDAIDDIHSFTMSFQDEFDSFGGLFPAISNGRFPLAKAWWQGPNVCVREEVKTVSTSPTETSVVENAGIKIYGGGRSFPGSLHFRTSYCVSSANSYKCNVEIGNSTSKTIKSEIHECCQGYARNEDDRQPGCNKVLVLANLESTIEKLGLSQLKDALEVVGLDEVIRTQNMTIFAPSDDAMTEYEKEEEAKLASHMPLRDAAADLASSVLVGGAPVGFSGQRRPLIVDESLQSEAKDIESTLLGHLVPGFLRSSSVADEQLVETLSDGVKLRINVYDHQGLTKKLVTANCAPVTSADNQALNGIVHVVDRVIKPPTKGSLMDVIASDPQFSMLKSMVGKSGLSSLLREEGSLTIFAPTNPAFEKLPKKILKRLLKGKGDECVRSILETHIIGSVICSAAIVGESHVYLRNNKRQHFNASRVDNKFFVGKERAQVTLVDVMATNGVLHAIDAVLLPDDGLDLVQVARKKGGESFANLVDEFKGKGGLAERLETTKNLTIFVPTDEAFEKLEGRPDRMEDVVKHHVVPESTIKSIGDLSDEEPLRTLNLKNPLHVQEFNVWPHGRLRTVQCANVVSRPIKGCNGNIMLIDRVLLPPKGNVIDVLALNANLTRLVGLLKSAGMADDLQGKGPFSIFAPNDEAFDSMRNETLERLKKDPELLKTFLQNHIAEGVTCCAMIRHGGFMGSGPRISTLASKGNRGNQLRLHSFHGLHNFVNHAQILECDNVGTNGVVHVLNDVLKPTEMQRPDSRHHSMDSFFRRIFDPALTSGFETPSFGGFLGGLHNNHGRRSDGGRNDRRRSERRNQRRNERRRTSFTDLFQFP